MKKIMTAVVFCVLSSVAVCAAGTLPELSWDRSGEVQYRVYQDVVDNDAFEDDIATDAWVKLKNTLSWKDQPFRVIMNMKARGQTFVGNDTRSQIDLDAQEMYVAYEQGQQRITAGNQVVTWGKLDDVVILDRINPQDYRDFILYDKQERKTPEVMFKYEYFQGDWTWETVFLPFFNASSVKYFDSQWAAFGHLKQAIAFGNYPVATKVAVAPITVEEYDRVTDRGLKNGQGGVRWRGRVKDVDVSISYMSLYHSLPTLNEKNANGNIVKQFLYNPSADTLAALVTAGLSADDCVLEAKHPRTNILGIDWETVVGIFGVRGEFAMQWGIPFLRENMAYTTKDVVSIGVGVDHTTENNTYLQIQAVEDIVLKYDPLYAQEENTLRLVGTVTKEYSRGHVVCDLDWASNISTNDWMVNPEVIYKWDAGWAAAFGGFVFSGSARTTFGAYTTKDLVYIRAVYTF